MGQPPVRDGTGPAGKDRWRVPGELKHLSTPRKQNQQDGWATDHPAQLVGTPLGGEARSSGERTGPAPKPGSLSEKGSGRWGCRACSDVARRHCVGVVRTRRVWEGPPERVRVP